MIFQRHGTKGQIQAGAMLLAAAISMVGGIFTARITANSTVVEKLGENKGYDEVSRTMIETQEKRVDRLEGKIDWLIQHQGGNLDAINNNLNAKK